MNQNEKVSWRTILSVSSVAFGIHVGGGFATGNQTVTYFVKYGWWAAVLPFVAMLILNLVFRSALINAQINKSGNYRQWADGAFAPFSMVFGTIFEICFVIITLIAVATSIAGAGSLLETYGIPYNVGILLTSILFLVALIVCMRGKTGCRDTFKKLAEELEEKIQKGEPAFKEGEKYRIMWDGIACWPYLSHNYKAMRALGMNMTGSTYPRGWKLDYDKDDIRSMARAYTSVGNNLSLEAQIDLKTEVVKTYNCQGVTYHLNRSCKCMDFLFHEMQTEVARRTDTPYITFDGDQSDPRNFSKAQFETRVQGLAEMMEQRKS